MGKIDEFYITFDEKWSVYKPGQTVTGKVVLKLNDHLTWCTKVSAFFNGSARVLWIENDIPGCTAYSSECIFFNEKLNLWPNDSTTNQKAKVPNNDQNDGQGLQTGFYNFEFAYTLPHDLPTSFEAKHSPGYVRYSLKICILDNKENIKISRKAYFSVVQPLDLNLVSPSLATPIENNYVKNLTNYPSKQASRLKLFSSKIRASTLQVKISIPKTGFVPGERIELDVMIKNDSPLIIIKVLKAHLIQTVTAFSEKPDYKMKEECKKLSTVADYTKIGMKSKKSEYCWKIANLYIPAVVPSFCLDNLLDVRYVVQIELSINKELVIFGAEVPITVGTVPLDGRTSFFVENWKVEKQALPAYDNFAMDIPPPTYEETLAGTSRVDSSHAGLFVVT